MNPGMLRRDLFLAVTPCATNTYTDVSMISLGCPNILKDQQRHREFDDEMMVQPDHVAISYVYAITQENESHKIVYTKLYIYVYIYYLNTTSIEVETTKQQVTIQYL